MRRSFCLLIALLAFTGVACPPAPTTFDPPRKDGAKKDKPPEPVANLEQLKPRIEAALDQVRSRDLMISHGFWTVFHGILGTGLERTTLKNPKTKEKVNAIDYICKGGEMQGLVFVPTKHGLDVEIDPAKQFVGQGHQDQFIAEMAQWGMLPTRPFNVGGRDFAFQDFIRHSKMRASVKANQELSWAIIIIAQFYGTDHAWTNGAGETLRFDDVVRYELDQSVTEAACGGTHRLFGLTWAYHLHLKKGGLKEGVWKDAEAKIAEHIQIARKNQNNDGSLSTEYFKGPGKNEDTQVRISTSGHAVEWLALALTDEELRSPWMQNAVNALSLMILDMGKESIDGGALYHAAHGLHIYHERVFGTPAPFLALPPKK